MNIKEHIEAGHYQKDDKGRPLVPVLSDVSARESWTATIVATDGPGGGIIGFGPASPRTWFADGRADGHPDGQLVPPAPRKVTVKAWAIIGPGPYMILRDTKPAGVASRLERLVELTGEYEETWA